jgi:hypothetical protein
MQDDDSTFEKKAISRGWLVTRRETFSPQSAYCFTDRAKPELAALFQQSSSTFAG